MPSEKKSIAHDVGVAIGSNLYSPSNPLFFNLKGVLNSPELTRESHNSKSGAPTNSWDGSITPVTTKDDETLNTSSVSEYVTP